MDDADLPTDFFDRTCEVIVPDDDDHEVPCGRPAAERVHGWWMCDYCFAHAGEACHCSPRMR